MFDKLYSKLNTLATETKAAFYEGLEDLSPEVLIAFKQLSLDSSSDFDAVKKKYRHLSKLYHPDSGLEKNSLKFIVIKDAYDVLKYHFKKGTV